MKSWGGSHIGNSTMLERADAIRGHLEITSEVGSGTEVRISVNIPRGTEQTGPLGEPREPARTTQTIGV